MPMTALDMHIALFVPTLTGGGAERVFVQLANGLSSRVKRVDLVVAQATGYYRQHVAGSVNLVSFDTSRTIGALFALRNYMDRRGPDVMLSTMTEGNIVVMLAALLARRPPPIVVREGILMSENLQGTFKKRVLKILARLLYPRADSVVALSKGVAAGLENEISGLRQRVTVIYNPGPSRQELSLGGCVSPAFIECKTRGPVFLAMGRLTIQKDYPTLIRAFAKVRQTLMSTLWILGEGEERPAIQRLVGELGLDADVFLPGFADDPYPYLKTADVFVMSSRYEGGPSAMLQAMACGCTIVSTDAPSGPAEFLEDGAQGCLVPVGDVESFAAAMLRAVREPVSQPLRELSMRRFEPAQVVDQYLHFLFDVATRRPRAARREGELSRT